MTKEKEILFGGKMKFKKYMFMIALLSIIVVCSGSQAQLDNQARNANNHHRNFSY